MNQEKSYDWLLEGCHHSTQVALAYYPNYACDSSAVRVLRRSITEHARMFEALTAEGYTRKTVHLTPKQIGIIVYFWGPPTYVKDGIEKNPYLTVPRKYGKI